MSFTGFTEEAFEVFCSPDLASRMPLLKERITPRLRELGVDLLVPLSKLTKEEMHPHVALHIRRTVNPPEATWVAFGREKRAYKPYVHYRATILPNETRMTCFVEDYADDKLLFADNLTVNAAAIAAHCANNRKIREYSLGAELTEQGLIEFADRIRQIKGQHAIFGISISRRETLKRGADLPTLLLKAAKTLKPFYDLGRK